MRLLCALGASLLAGLLSAHQDLRAHLSTLAIVGAKVETSPGRVVDNATVITRSGRIVDVGVGIPVPPGAEVVEGKGLFVYAGFIDAGVTKGVKSAGPRPRQGDPTDPSQNFLTSMLEQSDLVHPETVAADTYDPDDSYWKTQRSAGFTTVALVPSGAIFSGQVSLVNLSGRAARNATVDPSVAQSLAARSAAKGYPGTTLGAMATARQAFLDAEWSQRVAEAHYRGLSARGPADLSLLALSRARSARERFWLDARSSSDMEGWTRLAGEFGLRLVYWAGKDSHLVAGRLAPGHAVVRLDQPKEPTKPAKPTPEFDETLRLWKEQAGTARSLSSAGWTVAFSSADSTSFWEALRAMVQDGLPRETALAGLTTNAAKILGASGQLGRVAPGLTANLTVLTADFLSPDAKVKILVIDGVKLDPAKEPFKFDNGARGNDEE